MKNLLIALAVFITATMASYSLNPVMVVVNTADGSDISIELSNGTSAIYTEDFPAMTPNSSSLISFVVGKGNASWTNILASSVTTAHTIDVFSGTTLIAQYRLDFLIEASARAGLVGGDLRVSGETTFEGDVIVKGNTIYEGMFGLSSDTFSNIEELGDLETNIMIYTGNGFLEFDEDDLSEDLLDNSVYYIVNEFNEGGDLEYDHDNGPDVEIEEDEMIILLKAGGDFYIIEHPNGGFEIPQD